MARRQTADLNLDSLMDALTNVVGILVIVLVMTSLDVSTAVQRIKRVRPEEFGISEQDLLEARQQLRNVEQASAELQDRFAALSAALAEDRQRLEEDKAAVEATGTVTTPEQQLESLTRLIEQRQRKLRELEKQLAARQDEQASLRAMLETTKPASIPPPKVVRLPHPRPAPKGLEPVQFICRNGRVMRFDTDVLKERGVKRVQYLLRPFQRPSGQSGEVPCDRIVEQFNEAKIADQRFQLKLVEQNYNLMLQFDYVGGGETESEIKERNSDFQIALRRLDKRKQFIQYLVWSDSFDVYLASRRLSDQYGLSAGWQPYDVSYQWRTGLGFSVPCAGKPKPKPRPKPPTPAIAQPPRKPLPVDQID